MHVLLEVMLYITTTNVSLVKISENHAACSCLDRAYRYAI